MGMGKSRKVVWVKLSSTLFPPLLFHDFHSLQL